MKNRTSVLLFLIFISLFLLAFSPFEKEAPESREGRKKYAVGEMAEAEKEFDKASKRLENNAEAYYDLGNALQSQQKFEEALNAYQKSLETGKTTENLRSKIFHNMGNSFAGLGKYQDAEKFYMKSLEEEPSKESAENLEIVRRIIAQQKEQEEQQKQQQEKQDKQENQEQQNQEKEQEKQENKDENQPDDEQKQQPETQDEDNGEGNDDEQNSGMNDEDSETQDEEENQSSAAEAEEQDDEQQSEDKPKESSVLKQFKQRKNLQISPFMLKKEQKSDSDQTW